MQNPDVIVACSHTKPLFSRGRMDAVPRIGPIRDPPNDLNLARCNRYIFCIVFLAAIGVTTDQGEPI